MLHGVSLIGLLAPACCSRVARSVGMLFAARALQGLTTGAALGAAGAALLDLHPREDGQHAGLDQRRGQHQRDRQRRARLVGARPVRAGSRSSRRSSCCVPDRARARGHARSARAGGARAPCAAAPAAAAGAGLDPRSVRALEPRRAGLVVDRRALPGARACARVGPAETHSHLAGGAAVLALAGPGALSQVVWQRARAAARGVDRRGRAGARHGAHGCVAVHRVGAALLRLPPRSWASASASRSSALCDR